MLNLIPLPNCTFVLQIGREAMSCRETAAVFNLSSSAKLFIHGPEARQALQWICTADIDKPTNSFVFDKPIRIYCASIDRFHFTESFTRVH